MREAVCAAAVDAGYEFACFDAGDAFVTESKPDVEPPAKSEVTPLFRSAATDSQTSSDSGPEGPSSPDDAPGSPQSDGGQSTVSRVDDRPVSCISREDGYTVTVPVVDDEADYGTLALGADDRVADAADREELEAVGVVVAQALTRLDAAAERDRLRETLRTERRQFEKLHSVAAAMVGCEEPTSIYHLAIDAAENILEFDICGIDVVEDGYFVPIATSTGMESDGSEEMQATEGVAGETFQENETIIVDDVDAHPLAEPVNPDYKSVLSVPIEDVGIFQAGSTERGAFSTTDAELVELLMAHVAATLQRLRSDEALRESEQKYRTLIEQSHDAVVIYQAVTFSFANQRATGLFGRERDDLLDARVCELFHSEDHAKLRRVLAELTDEVGRQETFEGRIRRPNGDVRFCEFSATSIDYDGDVAVLASIRDITERKARERDLQRQNERLDEFASVVSHDLRSPINVARGSVDLARSNDDLSHLDRAADALDRMEVLVEDILQLARQGQLVDDTDAVALDSVAVDAWQSIDAPEATLDVQTDATVDADRTRLRELFENLFRNAVEHGGDAVTITVTADEDSFAVVDDGKGLPADSHEDVFERGFTSAADGTGFGLAIVESIADAHGWSVDAVSPPAGESPERGARFEISGCSPD
ncbi:MAG: PAS domain S-box protein [Halobacterium sp.]